MVVRILHWLASRFFFLVVVKPSVLAHVGVLGGGGDIFVDVEGFLRLATSYRGYCRHSGELSSGSRRNPGRAASVQQSTSPIWTLFAAHEAPAQKRAHRKHASQAGKEIEPNWQGLAVGVKVVCRLLLFGAAARSRNRRR